MSCFYFIPARRFDGAVPDVVKGAELVRLGLGHLDGAPLAFRGVVGSGPGGTAGLCIGLRIPANETGYYPDRQEWHPADGGNLYIGWPKGLPPGPETFIRADALPPENAVTMADGRVWELVPTASLPEVMGYSGSGEVVFRPRARDAAHFEASAWLYGYAQAGEPAQYLDVLSRVAVCFGARYHVSLIEVLALGLFSTELLNPVVLACLGLDEKKTD